jgi:phosphoribosylaminoimidazole (AIR) synthetase
MGIGLIAVVRAESAELAVKLLPGARVIGRLESGKPSVRYE